MISVTPSFSPNPHRQRNFTVGCHSHRVFTTVTSTPAVVRRWIFKMKHRHVFRLRRGKMLVGIGVQWTPGFQTPSTLQLCVGHHCLIFQLLHARLAPLCLRRFLVDRNVTFVGVSNFNDEAMLQRSRHRLSVWKLLDLRVIASVESGCSRTISMEKLAEILLKMDGVTKDNEVGRSDWGVYCLSEAQVEYACVDAFISFLLGKALSSYLRRW